MNARGSLSICSQAQKIDSLPCTLAGENYDFLQPRDLRFLKIIAEGYILQDVAAEIGCTRKSLESRLSTLRDEFYCRSTLQLVAKLIRNNII